MAKKIRKLIDITAPSVKKLKKQAADKGFTRGVKSYIEHHIENIAQNPPVKTVEGSESEEFEEG